ncbi:MAG TPA: tetratricopeptide repeat protein [Steroidobacteraceae bacterium]|jgi:predicted negative regulator of RcsB-dependent stress response|nr:tetratricopeptide repeat protein [Steroidobacteraceae bacterium]
MTEEYLTDDEQLEAVKHMLVDYAPWLIGGVLAGLAVFFGMRYFDSYTNERALKAAAQFSAMTTALQENDQTKSRQIADALIKDYASSPYADQAQLTLARLDVDDGQLDKAIAPLTQVMNESKDTELRQIARLRLARVLTDQGKADQAIKTLAEPAPPAFAARYHEVRGDAYLAQKDISHAAAEYQAALAAADAGGIDASLLELKIQDLGAAPAPVAKAVSVDTLNKAKP